MWNELQFLLLCDPCSTSGVDYAIDAQDESEEDSRYQVPVLKIFKETPSAQEATVRRTSHFYGRVTKETTEAADGNSKQSTSKSRPPKPRWAQLTRP